jgi:hypothetical protein
VAYESGGPGNGLLYALLAGLCIVVAGGGWYVYQNSSNLLDTAAAPPFAQEAARISTLVDTARAAIARRDYVAADHALDEAEHIDSHDPAVVRARHDLAEAAHPPGRHTR